MKPLELQARPVSVGLEQLIFDVRQWGHRQALEAARAEAQKRKRRAEATRERRSVEGAEWLGRRIEGRKQEEGARKDIRRLDKKIEELPSGRVLQKRVEEGVRMLGAEGQRELERRLTPAQMKTAWVALDTVQRDVENARSQAQKRGRGL